MVDLGSNYIKKKLQQSLPPKIIEKPYQEQKPIHLLKKEFQKILHTWKCYLPNCEKYFPSHHDLTQHMRLEHPQYSFSKHNSP